MQISLLNDQYFEVVSILFVLRAEKLLLNSTERAEIFFPFLTVPKRSTRFLIILLIIDGVKYIYLYLKKKLVNVFYREPFYMPGNVDNFLRLRVFRYFNIAASYPYYSFFITISTFVP